MQCQLIRSNRASVNRSGRHAGLNRAELIDREWRSCVQNSHANPVPNNSDVSGEASGCEVPPDDASCLSGHSQVTRMTIFDKLQTHRCDLLRHGLRWACSTVHLITFTRSLQSGFTGRYSRMSAFLALLGESTSFWTSLLSV